MAKILFLENDIEYSLTITKILEKEGFEVIAVHNSLDAIEQYSFNSFDLVLSDLYVDDLTGLHFLKYVKQLSPNQKTVLLTGKPSNDTELESLDLLVDKYLKKDTRLDVLVKHIKTLVDHTTVEDLRANKTDVLRSELENIQVNLQSYTVIKNGEMVELSTKQFLILKLFLQSKGMVFSRQEIIASVWEIDYIDVDDRIVDQYVKELRKRLGIQCIVSIRGIGYKWDE